VRPSSFSIVLFAALGCSSSSAPGADAKITVRVLTDFACKDFKGATIAIAAVPDIAGKAPDFSLATCDPSGIVGEVVIPKSKLAADPTVIEVVAGALIHTPEECKASLSGPCVIARRLLHPPTADATIVIKMGAACSAISCGVTDTCVAGVCVAATVDLSKCGDRGCDESMLGK
jgi:hypothetical protein